MTDTEIRDGLAGLLFPNIKKRWPGNPEGSQWCDCSGFVQGHPIPPLDSDAALGFAARVIGEAGYVWCKHDDEFIGFEAMDEEDNVVEFNVPRTGHDARDLMLLATRVLEKGK